MKLLLILPAYQPGKVTPREVSFPSRSLHIIAGLTSPEHQVEIVEEEYGLADIDEECDLVGISCMTSNVTRGYELADAYRYRGKTVVMGGIHPSLLPDEALRHCHCVVVGEAENVWENLLQDFHQGRLANIYSKPYPELDTYYPLRTDRINRNKNFKMMAIETTRGCPYKCDFCTSPFQFGSRQRHRPVEHVAREIRECGAKLVIFMDDNIFGNVSYAVKLLDAIAPLGIKWAGQTSIKIIEKRPDLLPMARNSGCLGLYFGVESISPAKDNLSKSIHNTGALSGLLKRVAGEGMHAHTGIIFGFDEDTEGVFDETLEFLQKNRIGSASFSTLIPYPGTEISRKFEEEGRILSRNWMDYHSIWGNVVFKPKNLTPEKLYLETARVRKEFSSFSSTLKRSWANRSHPLGHFLLNRGLHKVAVQSLSNWKNTYGETRITERTYN